MMKLTRKIKKMITTAKTIAVFTHISPDADCIGSSLAFKTALEKYNKTIDVYCEKIPAELKFLNIDDKVNFELLSRQYDLLVSFDTASKKQLGQFQDIFDNNDNIIEFDHHKSRTSFAKHSFIDDEKSSMCEILYDVLKQLKCKIDSNVATYLYCGLAGDTGCFKFDNTSALTHNVASQLISLGADYKNINQNLFSYYTKDEYQLLTLSLKNAIFNDNYAISIVDSKMLNASKIVEISNKNFANILLSVEGIDVAILAIEKESGVFSVSLRSKSNFDCSAVAKAFEGGGHFQASGCKIFGDANEIKKALIKEIKKIETAN